MHLLSIGYALVARKQPMTLLIDIPCIQAIKTPWSYGELQKRWLSPLQGLFRYKSVPLCNGCRCYVSNTDYWVQSLAFYHRLLVLNIVSRYTGDLLNICHISLQALVLRDYEDYIPPQQIYSLLALSSAVCESYGWCSKAFIRLESLDGVDEEETQQYGNTALEIFTRWVLSIHQLGYK